MTNKVDWLKVKPQTKHCTCAFSCSIAHWKSQPLKDLKNGWLRCDRFVLFQLRGDTTPGCWHRKLATVDVYDDSAYCVSLTSLIYVQKGSEAAVYVCDTGLCKEISFQAGKEGDVCEMTLRALQSNSSSIQAKDKTFNRIQSPKKGTRAQLLWTNITVFAQ